MSETDWLEYIEYTSFNTYDWVLVFAAAFLLLEILNDAVTGRFSRERFCETLSSLFTQVPLYLVELVLFGGIVYLLFLSV